MKRVLVVDDEPFTLMALSEAIHGPDVEVKSLKTGYETILEVTSRFYHICFLSIHLPDKGGIEIMKKIKEISPETVVVLMSSSKLNLHIEKVIEENACLYIPKPFEVQHLKVLVKEVFERIDGKGGDEGEPGEKDFSEENRKSKRRSLIKTIDFLTRVPESDQQDSLDLSADIVDISNGGVGIVTDFPLEPGQFLTFSFTGGIERRDGVVKWIAMIENRYRAGIEFV